MAFARLRYVALECDGQDEKYPYVVTAWRNVGDIYCGDRFTAGVADCLVEAWRADGIEVSVTGTPDDVQEWMKSLTNTPDQRR